MKIFLINWDGKNLGMIDSAEKLQWEHDIV